MTEIQTAIERQIESYKTLIQMFKKEAANEKQESLREMNRGHVIVLNYVIKDLQSIIKLFGEKEETEE